MEFMGFCNWIVLQFLVQKKEFFSFEASDGADLQVISHMEECIDG